MLTVMVMRMKVITIESIFLSVSVSLHIFMKNRFLNVIFPDFYLCVSFHISYIDVSFFDVIFLDVSCSDVIFLDATFSDVSFLDFTFSYVTSLNCFFPAYQLQRWDSLDYSFLLCLIPS